MYSIMNYFVPSNENPDDRVDCTVCNVHYIHKNDIQTHIKGREHKVKLRKTEKVVNAENDGATKICDECHLCKRKFTSTELYVNHLKCKKHKKEVKKIINKEPVITRRGRSIAFTQGRKRQEILREKYRQPGAKSEDENFNSYITSLAAYFSVILTLDDDIKDFKLSVHDKKWSTVGDIVLEIQTQRGVWSTNVIQCKNVFDTTKQIESFTDGKFNIESQFSLLSNIKEIPDMEHVYFIMFTTGAKTKKCLNDVTLNTKIFKKWSIDPWEKEEETFTFKPLTNKKREILNTTDDNEDIFFLSHEDISSTTLPKLYLFQNQKKSKHFSKMIDDYVTSKLDIEEKISKEYIKYIKSWKNGLLGGYFKLKKRDVNLKIGEILLRPHLKRPDNSYMTGDDIQNFELWNEVVQSVDVTIIDKSEASVITKIYAVYNKIVEDTFKVPIDSITKSIKTEQAIEKIEDKTVKIYLFETTECEKINIILANAYLVCWKSGIIPLFLRAMDRKSFNLILKVVSLMKPLHPEKSYILECVHQAMINIVPIYKSLIIFAALDDIQSVPTIFDKVLKKTTIKISENKILGLNTIWKSDKHFLKYITPGVFMDMCLGIYNITAFDGDSEKDPFEENSWKIVLPLDEVDSIRDAIVNVNGQNADGWLHGIDPEWI